MESQLVILPPQSWHFSVMVPESLRVRFTNLVHFFMFSSIFVGIACGSMVYVACFIQEIPFNPIWMAIMFLVCFSVYNLNRKTDEAEDAINREDRYCFTKKYEKYLYFSAILGCALASILSLLYGLMTFLLFLLPFIAGILYSIPFLPQKTGYRRLKEIPVVKNLVVSIAWAVPLTFISPTASHVRVTQATMITLIFFLGWAFIASTLPDVRDKEGDEQAGITTIPVAIGVERTLMLVTGINICIGTLTVILSLLFLSPGIALLILISTMYLHLLIRSFSKTRRKDIIFDFFNDGQFVIIGLMIWTGLFLSPLVASGWI